MADAAAQGCRPHHSNKIREGLSKRAEPKRIEVVIRQMALHLEAAKRLIRELDPSRPRAGRARRHTPSGGIRRRPDEGRSERVTGQAQAPNKPAPTACWRARPRDWRSLRTPAWRGRRHRGDGRGCETGVPSKDILIRARGQTPRNRLSSRPCKPPRIAGRHRARGSPSSCSATHAWNLSNGRPKLRPEPVTERPERRPPERPQPVERPQRPTR